MAVGKEKVRRFEPLLTIYNFCVRLTRQLFLAINRLQRQSSVGLGKEFDLNRQKYRLI